jgi:hypothetical protein
MYLLCSIAIRPNLKFKTGLKQLLGSLQLDIALPMKPTAQIGMIRSKFHKTVHEIGMKLPKHSLQSNIGIKAKG